MKSFHSGVSLSILFFLSLIVVARPQRFCGMKRRKEERRSRSLCDARKVKRNICVVLRDSRQFSSHHLVIVLLEAIRYTCLVSDTVAGSFPTASQVCAMFPHRSRPRSLSCKYISLVSEVSKIV